MNKKLLFRSILISEETQERQEFYICSLDNNDQTHGICKELNQIKKRIISNIDLFYKEYHKTNSFKQSDKIGTLRKYFPEVCDKTIQIIALISGEDLTDIEFKLYTEVII